jgi:light-harvesting protein B-800-850 alpha chain
MNQARIWLVVQPTVGLPLFLGTVLIISLLVHYSVLSNTTWMAAFFEGGTSAQTSSVVVDAPALAANREMAP